MSCVLRLGRKQTQVAEDTSRTTLGEVPQSGWHFSLNTFFFFFLGPHLKHMEVPRLGVESELQLSAYTTPKATADPSHLCDPHHSSWQCWILNPLGKARDLTSILMDTMSGS